MGCNKYCATGCLAGSDYQIFSHGDIGAFYNSIVNADLPSYTARAYHQSQNEIAADFKYDKIELKYDKELRDIRDSVHGAPIEAYIPRSIIFQDGASPSVIIRNPDVMPEKSVAEEILKAQAEVIGRKPEQVIIRTTEIVQEIHLKRRLRKVEIFKKLKTFNSE